MFGIKLSHVAKATRCFNIIALRNKINDFDGHIEVRNGETFAVFMSEEKAKEYRDHIRKLVRKYLIY